MYLCIYFLGAQGRYLRIFFHTVITLTKVSTCLSAKPNKLPILKLIFPLNKHQGHATFKHLSIIKKGNIMPFYFFFFCYLKILG